MNFLGVVVFIVFIMQVLSQALGENDILDSLGRNDAEGSESEQEEQKRFHEEQGELINEVQSVLRNIPRSLKIFSQEVEKIVILMMGLSGYNMEQTKAAFDHIQQHHKDEHEIFQKPSPIKVQPQRIQQPTQEEIQSIKMAIP